MHRLYVVGSHATSGSERYFSALKDPAASSRWFALA